VLPKLLLLFRIAPELPRKAGFMLRIAGWEIAGPAIFRIAGRETAEPFMLFMPLMFLMPELPPKLGLADVIRA
jgi:hypothetical protein